MKTSGRGGAFILNDLRVIRHVRKVFAPSIKKNVEEDRKMKKRFLLSATALACNVGLAGMASAQDAAQSTPQQQDNKEIIVTGVFSAKSAEKAPISINVVTSKELAQQNAASAADLLKNVPGVFVNSALGEIRNVVFSRGISANSLDGAGGYYYVSLQEDGLPVDLITASNYGPDYYLRSDINLGRLEGLRGGTAVITGPNAPGGIFNYISKNGKTDPGTQVDLRFGLQGDGKLPQYRADIYTADSSWTASTMRSEASCALMTARMMRVTP
jgi:outer membrane receptor protein involved in Fe transport